MSAPRRELTLQKKIVAAIKAEGGLARIIAQTPYTVIGDPDIAGTYLGRTLQFEVKEEGEKPTEIQLLRLSEWKAAGSIVGVVYSINDALHLLKGGLCCTQCFRPNNSARGFWCSKCRQGRAHKRITDGVREAKNKPCADCKKRYPYYVMSFDHRENKKFNVAQAVRRTSLPKLLEEIKKCDVVCMNCHQIRTFKRLTA